MLVNLTHLIDAWVPACGGTEVPYITRSGRKVLYVWQESTGKHGWLDCDSDTIMTDADAEACHAL